MAGRQKEHISQSRQFPRLPQEHSFSGNHRHLECPCQMRWLFRIRLDNRLANESNSLCSAGNEKCSQSWLFPALRILIPFSVVQSTVSQCCSWKCFAASFGGGHLSLLLLQLFLVLPTAGQCLPRCQKLLVLPNVDSKMLGIKVRFWILRIWWIHV